MNIKVAVDPTARATLTLPSRFSALKMFTVSMHPPSPCWQRPEVCPHPGDRASPSCWAGRPVGTPARANGRGASSPCDSSKRPPGWARGRRRRRGYRGSVRVATWNVNSVKQRVPRLLPWLDERRPDVVCLQETKLADDAFLDLLGDELRDRGYAVAVHGEARWNGVAILSRVGLDDVVAGLAGAPGFPHPESRAVSATCDGIRVVSVYVANVRKKDSEP